MDIVKVVANQNFDRGQCRGEGRSSSYRERKEKPTSISTCSAPSHIPIGTTSRVSLITACQLPGTIGTRREICASTSNEGSSILIISDNGQWSPS